MYINALMFLFMYCTHDVCIYHYEFIRLSIVMDVLLVRFTWSKLVVVNDHPLVVVCPAVVLDS